MGRGKEEISRERSVKITHMIFSLASPHTGNLTKLLYQACLCSSITNLPSCSAIFFRGKNPPLSIIFELAELLRSLF